MRNEPLFEGASTGAVFIPPQVSDNRRKQAPIDYPEVTLTTIYRIRVSETAGEHPRETDFERLSRGSIVVQSSYLPIYLSSKLSAALVPV